MGATKNEGGTMWRGKRRLYRQATHESNTQYNAKMSAPKSYICIAEDPIRAGTWFYIIFVLEKIIFGEFIFGLSIPAL